MFECEMLVCIKATDMKKEAEADDIKSRQAAIRAMQVPKQKVVIQKNLFWHHPAPRPIRPKTFPEVFDALPDSCPKFSQHDEKKP